VVKHLPVWEHPLSVGMRQSTTARNVTICAARNATICYCVECDYMLPRGMRLSATARNATICYRAEWAFSNSSHALKR
jgi:hypothetical protein